MSLNDTTILTPILTNLTPILIANLTSNITNLVTNLGTNLGSNLGTNLGSNLATNLRTNEFIEVPRERLNSLETLEGMIPRLIEKAIEDYKKDKLKKLHENDKKNPAGVNARVKRYNAKNKDKINAKRILKRNNLIITSTVIPPEQHQQTVLEGQKEFIINF